MNRETGIDQVNTPRNLTRLRKVLLGTGMISLALLVACQDVDPPLNVTGNGDVEGLVFFDASEDGVFDPSDGDFAVQGVGVAVRERGTEENFGTATSGADGRFEVAGVPIGTHDLFIDTLTVPANMSVCENPLRVSVFRGETSFGSVNARPGCLITIAAAKDLPLGTFVIVKGIVTSFPGQIDGGHTYIEDETAGGLIFSGSLEGLGIEIGDQIEIGATTGDFSNDFEFLSPILRSTIPDVDDPEPAIVTTADIAASGADFADPIQGAFIRVEAAQLTGAFGSIGNEQNAPLDDGSGGTVVRVDDGVADRADLNTIFTAGSCYNLNGFGANFNGQGQIFPRSLTDSAMVNGEWKLDFEEVPCS